MRALAIILCLLCVVIYAWDGLKDWVMEPQEVAGHYTDRAQQEVFPEAMGNIEPVQNLQDYIEQYQKKAQKISAPVVLEKPDQEKEKDLIEDSAAQKNFDSLSQNLPIEKVGSEVVLTDQLPVCYKMGPLSRRVLPAINRSIESAKLLEVVRVESVLSADSHVVFIIPTTTQKGAAALADQVRKKGYRSASVIHSGPLLNAVQLGSFSTQEQAQQFLESAKARLKMNDLRMTRIIGSPTDKVNLIFAALSDEQINALKGLAKKHGQVLSECGS